MCVGNPRIEFVIQPLSKTRYFRARRFASIAVASPVGPAPTIAISNESISLCFVIAAFGNNRRCRRQLEPPVLRPFHNQFSRDRMNGHVTARFSVQNRRYRGPARSRSRCETHTHAAFPEGNPEFLVVENLDELDIRTVREGGIVFQTRSQAFDELVIYLRNEQRAVGIAGRAKADAQFFGTDHESVIDDPIHRSVRDEGNLFRLQLRNTHVRLVLVAFTDQHIDPGDRPQLNLRLLPPAGFHQVCRSTTQSIAGAFGLAAIPIEDPQVKQVALLNPEDDAVCADSEIPMTDRLRKLTEAADGHSGFL